jgi:hypothetical protein
MLNAGYVIRSLSADQFEASLYKMSIWEGKEEKKYWDNVILLTFGSKSAREELHI